MARFRGPVDGGGWKAPSGGGGTVSVTVPITGDGSGGSPLAVAVDGTSVTISGGQLTAPGGLPPDAATIIAQRLPNANDDDSGGPLTATGGLFTDGSPTITGLNTWPLTAGLSMTTPYAGTQHCTIIGGSGSVTSSAVQSVQITNATLSVTQGAVVQHGYAQITFTGAGTAGMSPGDSITGTGVPGGATISTVDSGTQITLSASISAAVTFANPVAQPGQQVLDASQTPPAVYICQTNSTGAAAWSCTSLSQTNVFGCVIINPNGSISGTFGGDSTIYGSLNTIMAGTQIVIGHLNTVGETGTVFGGNNTVTDSGIVLGNYNTSASDGPRSNIVIGHDNDVTGDDNIVISRNIGPGSGNANVMLCTSGDFSGSNNVGIGAIGNTVTLDGYNNVCIGSGTAPNGGNTYSDCVCIGNNNVQQQNGNNNIWIGSGNSSSGISDNVLIIGNDLAAPGANSALFGPSSLLSILIWINGSSQAVLDGQTYLSLARFQYILGIPLADSNGNVCITTHTDGGSNPAVQIVDPHNGNNVLFTDTDGHSNAVVRLADPRSGYAIFLSYTDSQGNTGWQLFDANSETVVCQTDSDGSGNSFVTFFDPQDGTTVLATQGYGGLRVKQPTDVSGSTSYTMDGRKTRIVLTASSARAVTLPSASTFAGIEFVVQDGTGGTSGFTLTPVTDTINGGSSLTFGEAYQAATFFSDGTNWWCR